MKSMSIPALIISLILSANVMAKTVSIRADSWYPMNGEPGSEKEGFMIDFAREVFSAAGYDVDYKIMPWERAIVSTREGSSDCVVGAYTEDAPDFNFPAEQWGKDITGYFILNSSSWVFNNLDSLLTEKIGVIEGYAYGEDLDKLIASRKDIFKSIPGNDALEKNFKKLAANRIDVVIESVSVGKAKIKDMNLESKVKLGGQNPSSDSIYIACSPNTKGKALTQIVDEGTKAMRESGKLSQIMEKYGLSDWK